MIARHEVLLSLYGAWRLFLRDPRGIEWLDDSIEGYWKSFFCAVIVLPGYAVWVFMRGAGPEEASFIRILTVEGIEYVIQWVAWPLAMAYIAPMIGRDHNYIRYIVAQNWSAGVYGGILLIVLGLELFGFASGGGLAIIVVIATIIILTYHWYILRIGLEISGMAAAGLIAVKFVLGQLIHAIGLGMLR